MERAAGQPDQTPAGSLLHEGHTQSGSYTDHNFLPTEAEGVTVMPSQILLPERVLCPAAGVQLADRLLLAS